MKRALLSSCGLTLVAIIAFAQGIRSTSEEYRTSDDVFHASIEQKGNVYEICVYDSVNLLLWSAWIDWSDDLIGLLSEDGKVFAAIDAEYAEGNSLISIYRDGKTESYSTNAIVIQAERMKKQDGKTIWIKNEKQNIAFAYDGSGAAVELLLTAITGEVYSLSLVTARRSGTAGAP